MAKEDNGEAAWLLLRDRAQAQGRRLDTLENAMRNHAEAALKESAKTNERLSHVERDTASIKTTLKVVAGTVAFVSPLLTAVIVKVMS